MPLSTMLPTNRIVLVLAALLFVLVASFISQFHSLDFIVDFAARGSDDNDDDDAASATAGANASLMYRTLYLPMQDTLRLYRHASLSRLQDRGREAVCALVMGQTGNCRVATESVAECVHRFGKATWEKILGRRCTQSEFWQQTLPRLMKADARLRAIKPELGSGGADSA